MLSTNKTFIKSLTSIMNNRFRENNAIQRMRSKWRKIVTGDENIRIRDHLKQHKEEPTYIKLFDKISFTLGVLNIVACQYFLSNQPEHFWLWYSIVIPLLMYSRIQYFKTKNWQYFLLDFCYFTVLCNTLYLIFLNQSERMFNICFIYSIGPVAWAIIVWRCSLVFHDYDKMTSVYIHILPCMLFYSLRWYGKYDNYVSQDNKSNNNINGYNNSQKYITSCESISNYSTSIFQECILKNPQRQQHLQCHLHVIDFIYAIIGYSLWQFCYYIKTEVIDKDTLDKNPQFQTSLRYLSRDLKNISAKSALKLCRKLKLMRQDELFDSDSVKTKMIFMSTQFIYTLTTFVTVPIFYYSSTLHMAFIIILFCVAVYNGGEFYIEIFSERYQLQFRDKKHIQRVAQAAAEVAYEVGSLQRTASGVRLAEDKDATTSSTAVPERIETKDAEEKNAVELVTEIPGTCMSWEPNDGSGSSTSSTSDGQFLTEDVDSMLKTWDETEERVMLEAATQAFVEDLMTGGTSPASI